MITITADFSVKSDCIEKFIRLAAVCARNTRKENGNLSYRVYRRRRDDSKFIFIEEWLNDVVIEKHGEMPHFKEFLAAVEPLLVCTPEITEHVNVPEIRNI